MNTVVLKTIYSEAGMDTLPLRVGAGVIFAAHGAQKLFGSFGGYGLEGTGAWMESIGLAPGYLMALLAGSAEFFGGLLLTGNVISFFVMLGMLGLIGIAVNNTILLTDFANQERRGGADRKTAIEVAIRRRFRPLVATSLTTVAGVLPLALSDPFWEALGFTIIFGLLSSTFLVLVAFPYYYLAIEWLRDRLVTPWRPQSMRPGANGTASELAAEVAGQGGEGDPVAV